MELRVSQNGETAGYFYILSNALHFQKLSALYIILLSSE